MDLISIIVLAIALSFDCFTISLANGALFKHFQWFPVLRMAFLFGIFQGIMPLLGWFAGLRFEEKIKHLDPWLMLIVLSVIGLKMIYDGFASRRKSKGKVSESYPMNWKRILLLSFATSIDTLVVGITFVSSKELFFIAVFCFTIAGFLMSVAGSCLGLFFHKQLSFWPKIVGGSVLIVIGLKVFFSKM